MNRLLKNVSWNIKPIMADRRFDVPDIIIVALASTRIFSGVKTSYQ